jgi:tryptophan synthase alpha chain
VTDLPLLAGIGISTPAQARAVCEVADGAVVGAALVRRLLDGGGPEGAAAFVSELREALSS